MDRFEVDQLYISPDEKEGVSLITLNGTGWTICDLAGANSYEVISGSGSFHSDLRGKKVLDVEDVIFVPPGEVHWHEGDLVLLCNNMAKDPV